MRGISPVATGDQRYAALDPRPLFEKRGAKTFIKKFFIRLVMRGVRVDRSIASLAEFFALLTDGRIAPASI